jgi:LysR family transcriptional regulator of abg operon
VTPWITLTFLAETVLLFRKRMPDIQLELFESLMAVAQPLLRTGDMDFVIGQLHPSTATQEFSCEPVLNYETTVMVRRGHPRQHCRSIHELLDQDWALNFAPDGQDALIDYLFTRHGAQIEANRIVRAQSLGTLQMLVEHADMCTWCPTVLQTAPLFQSQLVALALKEKFDSRQLSIVTRRNSTLGGAAHCFIECLLQVIRKHARSAKKEDLALFDIVTLLV